MTAESPIGVYGGAILSSALPSAASVGSGTAAFTTDQGPLLSDGTNWNVLGSGGGAPTIYTYATLPAASSYPGYFAYTSDLGPVWSNGIAWTVPNTEGVYSLATCSASTSVCDRYPLGIAGQENSVNYYNGVYNAMYTNGSAQIGYAFCSGDPTVAANWSAPVVVIANGTGGGTSTYAHGTTYIEAGTLYYFVIDKANQNIVAFSAPLPSTAGTAPTFSSLGIVFTGVPGGGSANGNLNVIKVSGTYYMYVESLHNNSFPTEGSTNSWQTALLSCATVAGTYTIAVAQFASLRVGPNASVSGPNVFLQGSTLVLFFHGGSYGRCLPNDLYRATMPVANIATDGWTIDRSQSGQNLNPTFFRRKHNLEFDQVCDPAVCIGPTRAYLFYTASNNRAGLTSFQLMVTPLLATPYAADGAAQKLITSGRNDEPGYWEQGSRSWIEMAQPSVTGDTTLPVNAAVTTPGTWVVTNDTTTGAPTAYSVITNTTAATGDIIAWDTGPLLPGTYTLTGLLRTGPGYGVVNFILWDGSTTASPTAKTIDCYTASAGWIHVNITNFWILGFESFPWRLRANCASKNASSTAFQMGIVWLKLQRTGN